MGPDGNKISTKFYIRSHGEDKTRGHPNCKLTYGVVCEWIKLQGLDEYTTKGLIDMAGRIPTSALPHFRRNFNLMIARVRQKRQEEQRGFVQEEPVKEIGQ